MGKVQLPRVKEANGSAYVPGPGRTLSGMVEERSAYLRAAARLLEPEFRCKKAQSDFTRFFGPRWMGGQTSGADEPFSARIAWALVNIWLLARLNRRSDFDGSFCDAAEWFGGQNVPALRQFVDNLPVNSSTAGEDQLSRVRTDSPFLDLLPYALDAHGPGTRLSVMRDPSTRTARDAKRRSGIFYTPADVAEYMARMALSGHSMNRDLRVLDPSCGTGVFFVALLRLMSHGQYQEEDQQPDRRDLLTFATRCLYGVDISPLAIDSCAFVLLHHCMKDVNRRGLSPWAAWHALRLNLATADALKLQAPSRRVAHADAARRRQDLRDRLLDPLTGEVDPLTEDARANDPECLFNEPVSAEHDYPALGTVFPEAEEGFDVLIGNPPYADLGHRRDQGRLEQEYTTLRSGKGSQANLYPVFIEMMWRLARPGNCTGAMVVPLSISYHQGKQYRSCRQAMLSNGGRWRCAFFDREPHALFGEDVKTRNAILIRSELSGDPARGSPAIIETGALRKCTSRTREQLFSSITFTPLSRIRAREGLPKLSNPEQADAFSVLAARVDRLRTLCVGCRTCQPSEAAVAAACPRVFVASTAYNFLNVFRFITVDTGSVHPLSQNTVHCLHFSREEDAEVAFAILSSRLIFWLWHGQGDGFHVAASFIKGIPFGRSSFSPRQFHALRASGRMLWTALQAHRIVSLNRGKRTVAYRPFACEKERDRIDQVLLEAAGLSESFGHTLRQFVKSTVVVDETDKRRSHLKALFNMEVTHDSSQCQGEEQADQGGMA